MSRIGNFLADYANLCRHHGLCLTHETFWAVAPLERTGFELVDVAAADDHTADAILPTVGRLLPDGEST